MLSWPIVFVSIKRPTTLLPEVAHPRGVASTHAEYVAPSISSELVEGALRLSFWATTTADLAQEAARCIFKAYQHLRR